MDLSGDNVCNKNYRYFLKTTLDKRAFKKENETTVALKKYFMYLTVKTKVSFWY